MTCERCAVAFKKTSGGSVRFCKTCAATAGALESADDGALIGFARDDVVGGCADENNDESMRRAERVGAGGVGKKKKKAKKKAASGPNVRSDPMCLEILDRLDASCVLIDDTNADTVLKTCVEAMREADVVAVDCEGVMMSRTGPITVLQCATRDKIYLIDIQALGVQAFGARGSGGVRDLLESREAPLKLMFDCRMDSDALFHQYDVRLENVMDVQILDLATRRSLGLMIDRVAGIAKCTDKHLTEAETAVAADLKVRVRKLYAVEESQLWAERPLTEDARRYAALDVWLLIKLYDKMKFDLRDDKDDWTSRSLKESARRVLEFRELEVAIRQGVFTEESTVAPTF